MARVLNIHPNDMVLQEARGEEEAARASMEARDAITNGATAPNGTPTERKK